MKKIVAIMASFAILPIAAYAAPAKPVAKPAAKAAAMPLALPTMGLDEEEMICASVFLSKAEETSLPAEEKMGMNQGGFFFFGRVNARTNLAITPAIEKYVKSSPSANKIMQNPKLTEMMIERCGAKFEKLIGT